MAGYVRYDEAFLGRLRNAVDLPSLIARDAPLRRSGALWKGQCPFHQERTPSFVVGNDTGFYRCFGCNARGDAVQWMRSFHGMSFNDAVHELAVAHAVQLPQPQDEHESEEQHASRRHFGALMRALEEAQRIYRYGLGRTEPAQRYLTERGITAETCACFELGAVTTGVVHLMRSQSHEVLLGAGLAFEDEAGALRDRFRHRIMIPIRSHTGRLTGFAGRLMPTGPSNAPKYLNSPATELFQKGDELFGLSVAKKAIRKSSVAVLTEGYFDVIALHQHGEERAVAQMGTALTANQARLLLRHADSVILAYDGDAPGRGAALASALTLLRELSEGKTVSVLAMPDDADPDSFVRERGVSCWLEEVARAMPLSVFLGHAATSGLDISVAEARVAAAAKAREFLSHATNDLYQRALQIHLEQIVGLPLGPTDSPGTD